MVVQLAEDRPRLESENLLGADAEESATAFSTILACSGSYEAINSVVLYRGAMCSFANWVETVQTRPLELSDNELVLRTPPLEVGGRQTVHELRWIREEGQGWE
jgi:Lipocalin-like domain